MRSTKVIGKIKKETDMEKTFFQMDPTMKATG